MQIENGITSHIRVCFAGSYTDIVDCFSLLYKAVFGLFPFNLINERGIFRTTFLPEVQKIYEVLLYYNIF